jgi:DNA-nicking Smr family endonuclease
MPLRRTPLQPTDPATAENAEFSPADEPVPIPVDGILDLHCFAPAEVRDLVMDYLAECRKRGILEVRIIHGKGSGTLRRIVRSLLERHPHVVAFRTPSDAGGWGATELTLAPEGPRLETQGP